MKKAMIMVVCVMAVVNISFADNIRGIDIEFVTVGNAGNLGEQTRLGIDGDTTYYGGVNYEYRIGKYEVTNTQWNAFESVAGAPTGDNGNYGHVVTHTGLQQPVNEKHWYEALQFCNYLTTGDKSKGVYQWSGDNTNPGYFLGIDRNAAEVAYGAIYFLPTHDEWYKAAYHKNDGITDNYWVYPTQSDTITTSMANYGQTYGEPIDVGNFNYPSPYGTYDQGGNVWEWTESTNVFNVTKIVLRGGNYSNSPDGGLVSWRIHSDIPFKTSDQIGFRVASVPEPATLLLIGCGGLFLRRRKKL